MSYVFATGNTRVRLALGLRWSHVATCDIPPNYSRLNLSISTLMFKIISLLGPDEIPFPSSPSLHKCFSCSIGRITRQECIIKCALDPLICVYYRCIHACMLLLATTRHSLCFTVCSPLFSLPSLLPSSTYCTPDYAYTLSASRYRRCRLYG